MYQGIKLARKLQGNRVDIRGYSRYISTMYRAGENIAPPPAADLAWFIFASFNHVEDAAMVPDIPAVNTQERSL